MRDFSYNEQQNYKKDVTVSVHNDYSKIYIIWSDTPNRADSFIIKLIERWKVTLYTKFDKKAQVSERITLTTMVLNYNYYLYLTLCLSCKTSGLL